MSNVFSLERTSEYWVDRAARHRLAGRYDEAMALLSKAKDQFGQSEELALEMARVYDEMDCETEAARSYLRVVRMHGKHSAQALFQLALLSAQHADLNRADAYFERFMASDRAEVSPELSELLGRQIQEEMEQPTPQTRRERAGALERRAIERLQDGKVHAARRTLRHAVALLPSAQRLTLLACCALLLEDAQEAVELAEKAHRMAPARVQTLCVLADALYAVQRQQEGRRALYLAVLRAGPVDELLSVAMESAKHDEDHLTLRLTQALLRREPFDAKGMLLRACALTNLGRLREASKLFGRLCGLLPEDTVCQAYFRMTREGNTPSERMTLGTDVPYQEAVARAVQLISALYEDMDAVRADDQRRRTLCDLSAWAFRSTMAGTHTSVVALILMNGMNTADAREVMLDALTDPQVSDGFKCAILQAVTDKDGFKPYDVDMGGRLLSLAAGGVTRQASGGETSQQVVQMVSDRLSPIYPDAPQKLLSLYIDYLNCYGAPGRREQAACAAALEWVYHLLAGRNVDIRSVAARYDALPRLSHAYAHRILSAHKDNG